MEYDPTKVSYEELLDVFWRKHNPYRGQGQYRSAIWYHDEAQRVVAEASCRSRPKEDAAMVELAQERPALGSPEDHDRPEIPRRLWAPREKGSLVKGLKKDLNKDSEKRLFCKDSERIASRGSKRIQK